MVTAGYQLLVFPPGAEDLGFGELTVNSGDLDDSPPTLGENPVKLSDNDADMAPASSG
ncbi:hypothetical protein AAF712_014892 [Marasmius tenuissimus]|uniref:Uncharacterized protein n=1 Tax=Marasmius tenuissimus TaxID=585030 RepID=A0ABR2Z9T4_9AGAR